MRPAPSPRRRWTLIGAVVAFACLGAPAWAEPALWVARSPTATVYLFGTLHVVRPDTRWRSAKLDTAFAQSGEVWLEIANPDDQQVGSDLVQRFGLDPAHPLSTKLTPAQLAKLDDAAKRSGVEAGEAGLEPMRPWLAAVAVSAAPIRTAGYDMDSGVDLKLKAAAVDSGKPVRGFETYEQQIRLFADLSPENELALLTSATEEAEDGPARLDGMVAAWMTGDVDKLGEIILGHDVQDAPDLYRVLFSDRNAAFADAIAERLKGSGVSFVALGAGHLAGPDSVQKQLAARGIAVVRE